MPVPVEGLLAALLLAAALIPWLRRVRAQRLRALGLCGVIALSSGLAWASGRLPRGERELPDVRTRPLEQLGEGYVGSQACVACHPGPHASWSASYHRGMAQVATPETVRGDFEATGLRFDGLEYHVARRGDAFYVGLPTPGQPRWERVVQTTGSHSMQVYWFATGEARTLDQFPLIYLLDEQRWIPRNAAFLRPPALQAAPPSERSRWNRTCVLCHSTHPQSRMLGFDTADTQVAELGIACEACHGPGEAHVEANHDPARRYAEYFSADPDPTIVNPARLEAARSSEVCGQCHSVFYSKSQEDYERDLQEGLRYRPGERLEDTRHVVRCTPDPEDAAPLDRTLASMFPGYMERRFWSDGAIRVGGREHNALLASPCFQGGELSCLSCHELHPSPEDPRALTDWADDQLRAGARGDASCVGCHEEVAAQGEAHTLHPAGSAGSACMNCHMPHTTYALLKAIRSHTVSSPSVGAELDTGRPNACNLCHLDKSLGWAADALAERYGQPRPDLDPLREETPAGVRWLTTGDAGIRALAAWSLGWTPAQEASGRAWIPGYLAEALDDPYVAVRFVGARSLRSFPELGAGYDPLADPEARRAAVEALRDAWRRDAPAPGPGFPHDANGAFTPRYTELLEQRDQRPVDLVE